MVDLFQDSQPILPAVNRHTILQILCGYSVVRDDARLSVSEKPNEAQNERYAHVVSEPNDRKPRLDL